MKPFLKSFLLLFLLSPFFIFNSFAQQAPGIQWQNTIGGNNIDHLNSFQQTTDGGYILAGSSRSDSSGDKIENSIGNYDYWIIKIDSSGNIKWQNTIGGSDIDEATSIKQTSDGGYICGGYSQSNISGDKTENSNGGYDYWILKLDSAGNIQWQNSIGGNNVDGLSSIEQTSDVGYILGGYSVSNISGDKTENSNGAVDFWIIKIDSSGTIIWQNTIGGGADDYLTSVQQTSDGGYILGGWSSSNISGDKTENNIGLMDYWIVKTDSIGDIQWQNTIGANDVDELSSIEQTSDGGFILGGFSRSNISGDKTENSNGGDDYWIVKTNNTGNIQWQNTIGGNNTDFVTSLHQIPDGNYIIGGYSNSNISGDKNENCIGGLDDYWILKIDTTGSILWQNTIGGDFWDNLTSVKQTSDNGYILGGFSASNISGDKTENSNGLFDFWVVKLYPDTLTGIFNLQLPTSSFQIFPNPSSGIFQISFPSDQKTNYTLEVFNTFAQKVFSTQPETKNQKPGTTLNLSFLPKGIYLLKISDSENVKSKVLIID